MQNQPEAKSYRGGESPKKIGLFGPRAYASQRGHGGGNRLSVKEAYLQPLNFLELAIKSLYVAPHTGLDVDQGNGVDDNPQLFCHFRPQIVLPQMSRQKKSNASLKNVVIAAPGPPLRGIKKQLATKLKRAVPAAAHT